MLNKLLDNKKQPHPVFMTLDLERLRLQDFSVWAGFYFLVCGRNITIKEISREVVTVLTIDENCRNTEKLLNMIKATHESPQLTILRGETLKMLVRL